MLEIGMRVTILYPNPAKPQQGVIYDYVPSRRWPYHILLDGWPEDKPGIACTEAEWEPLTAASQEVPRDISS